MWEEDVIWMHQKPRGEQMILNEFEKLQAHDEYLQYKIKELEKALKYEKAYHSDSFNSMLYWRKRAKELDKIINEFCDNAKEILER